MPSQKNIDQVKSLKELLEKSKAVVLTDYAGLSVKQQVELREQVKDAGGQFLVTKNRLFKLALQKGSTLNAKPERRVEPSEIDEYLQGTTAFIFAFDDEIAPIKALITFAQKNDLPKTKVGLIFKPEDRVLTIEEINELASLPTLNELRALFIGALNAPRSRFVNVLSGNLRGLVLALKQIQKQKQSN